MTDCVNCGADLMRTRSPRVRVLGDLEVCDHGCAVEMLSDPPIVGLHQCAGCGTQLTASSETPDGYNFEHCSSCCVAIKRRKGTLSGGKTA